MKFKQIFSILGLSVMSAMGVQAQDCAAEVSVYTEYYKVKNYDDAFKPWKHAFDNCPDATKNLYIHGPRIVENKIKKSEGEEKEALIDLLMKVYDQRLQYFPGKKGYVLGNKGADLYKYRTESAFEEAFTILDEVYNLDGTKMSASAIVAYFQASGKMYSAEKIDKAEFFRIYDNVNQVIDANLDGKKAKYYELAAENVEKLVAPYADCADLKTLYQEAYPNNKEDAEWLSRALRMMDKKKCTENDIYFDMAGQLYQLAPSAASAGSMGKMATARKQYSDAVKFFKEAIDGTTDKNKLAEYYLELAYAQSKMKQFSTARSNALKAAELKANFGRPYILIASMYGESAGDCGSNDFERRAVYWAAMDMCAKAKAIDKDVAEIAQELYNSYAKSAPDKTLIFTYGYLDKPEYKIGCWINASTKVRVP